MDKCLNINNISIKKRNGQSETFNIDKIHRMVARACEDLTGVSVSDVVMEAKLNFFDGMSSVDIHRSLTRAATQLITEHTPNYQYVAGRLLNYDIRKTAWGGMEPPRLYDHIVKMVNNGFYTKDLLDFYSEEQWDKIETFIDHDRDLKIPHIGVSEYMTKYAIRDRSLDEIVPLETPQITYILIAALVCSDTKSLKDIKSYYNHISQYNISLPTPIMAGLRSPEKQFSSCTLIETEDNLDSIYATSHAIGKYISKRAGIGICASAIRAEGSKIRNGEIKHTGVIPFFRLFESSVKSCSQGGVRGGAATLYTMLWHLDIEDILVLKNNKGTPETRVRKIDYAIQINNYLYRRLIQGQDITLFSPHDVRDLYDAFFSDQEKFAELYEKYEKDDSIRKKKVPASELFTKLMIERKDTGRIYIMNVDNANNSSPFSVPIKMSNLCLEILLPTAPFTNILDENGRIALCTLSAINIANLKSIDDLEDLMYWAVRGLDNILSYQDYPVIAAQKATEDFRPLGIGTINLAYYLAKNGFKYGDSQALNALHEIYEAMEFYGLKASVKLAKERGPCRMYEQTKYAKGLLPIDWYNKNVDELVKPNYKLPWEWLREEIKKYGVRNATITAHMPAESSCKPANATNGVEPVRALITTKGNKSNISKQVVPEINRLKNKYDLLWDMKSMEGVIKTMAVIQKFCSQSISTNLSYNPAHYENGEIPMSTLVRDLLLCNKLGIKTLYYHNTNDQRDVEMLEKNVKIEEQEVKAENEVCDSCVI
jgi:ribonucleoside-diphosphate reductase alpha chain